MFQFRRFPTYTYFIQCTLHGYCPCGLPHSEIRGSRDICSSPRLIAACHVLHRLLMPRHSPCALFSLTYRRSKVHSTSLLLLSQRNLLRWAFVRPGTENRYLSRNDPVREILVLSRIMQALQILEIVIVTLHPCGCCSTIIVSRRTVSLYGFLSVALLHLHYIVQFSRCVSNPLRSEISS